MSNPAVLYLNVKRLSNGVQFRIEDNIGEAIHLHYGDEWRIDLRVKDFLSLDKIADDCLRQLLGNKGFNLAYFDPFFLDMISSDLINLKAIQFENIKLSELLVETRGLFNLPIIRGLNKSRIFKALNGSTHELKLYKQENYRGQTNIDRVNSMKDYLSSHDYPFDNNYIVLFNSQNVIRDGQHRAACLLYLKGDIEIPIVRMLFRDDFNNVSLHPWVNVLFNWNLKRIKNCLKKGFRFVKIVIRKQLKRIKYKLS